MGAIDTYPPQNITAQTPTLAYAEVVAAQPSISTEVNLTGLTVTFTVPAGRRIKVSVKGRVDNDATAGNVVIRVFEGATELGRIFEDNVTAGDYRTAESSIVLSPTAGTHTYQVKGWKDTGAGVFGWNAWSTNPSYILVEDITGSPLPVLPQSVPVGVLAQSYLTAAHTGITSTETNINNLSINVTVPAGRILRISVQAEVYGAALGDIFEGKIRDEANTQLTRWTWTKDPQGAGNGVTVQQASAIISPAAGSHTYRATGRAAGGTTVNVSAGPTNPAYILVEDITPTPAPASGAPSSTLGYAEIVANSVGFTAVTDITGLSVTVTVPAGRRIRVSAKGALAATAGTPGWGSMYIYESGVMKGNWRIDTPLNVSEGAAPSVVLSPSAGTHTYYVRGECDTGTCVVAANGNEPAYILVEDITGTSSTVTPGTVGGGSSTLAYSQVVTTQNITNTVAPGDNLTGLAVTVTVPAGRRLKVTGYGFFSNSASASARFVILDEANNYLADSGSYINSAGASEITALAVFTPTEGTHTYRLAARTSAGTLTFGGYSTIPGFILVEDITGVSAPVQPTSVPVGRIGYSEITSVWTLGATGVATLIPGLSANVVVPAGRILRITAMAHARSSVATDAVYVGVQEDGVGKGFNYINESNTVNSGSAMFVATVSPSAGSHTYAMLVQRQNGSGSISVYADSLSPSWIMIEDITPTPAPSSGAPGSTLGYAEVVADQTGITSVTDLTGLAVTVTVPAGRRIRIRGQGLVSRTIADGITAGYIREGSTVLTRWFQEQPPNTNAIWGSGDVVISPSAGTHTYVLSLERFGTGSVGLAAGVGFPASILVEDVTGSVWPGGSPVTSGMIASEAWNPFTPVWTSSGTQPAIGNGSLTGRYMKIGRTVFGIINLTAGSTTTWGTGVYYWVPPVPISPSVFAWALVGSFKGYNGGSNLNAILRHNNAGSFQATYSATWPTGAETHVGQLTPWTWVNGNNMDICFTYEAAS